MKVENKDFWKLSGIVLGLVAAIILLMLSGCKTRYIASEPVIVHERDSIVRVNTLQVHDTLHTRDSIYHFVKGDSTIIERWHYVNNINRINTTDTVYQDKLKEIPVPYPKPYPVEKELTRWQKIKMSTGGYLFGLLGIAVVGGICYIFRRRIPIIKNLVK